MMYFLTRIRFMGHQGHKDREAVPLHHPLDLSPPFRSFQRASFRVHFQSLRPSATVPLFFKSGFQRAPSEPSSRTGHYSTGLRLGKPYLLITFFPFSMLTPVREDELMSWRPIKS